MKGIDLVNIVHDSRPNLDASHTRKTSKTMQTTRSGSTLSNGRQVSAGCATISLDKPGAEVDELPERPSDWRGMNLKDPLKWELQATRAPTVVFDLDFTPEDHPYSLLNSEYGHDDDPAHQSQSAWSPKRTYRGVQVEEPPFRIFLFTYMSCECYILPDSTTPISVCGPRLPDRQASACSHNPADALLVDAILHIFGHLREIWGKMFYPADYKHLRAHDVSETLRTNADVPHHRPTPPRATLRFILISNHSTVAA